MGVPVCKFYNTYFKSGCVHGKNCSFRHLKQREFTEYCRKLNLRKPLSPNEIRRMKNAQRHFREHRFAVARKIFGFLANKYPFHQGINIWLARTHDKVSVMTDNIQYVGCASYYYRKAISIDPGNAYYHGRYASSAYWLGQHAQCRVHFEKALALQDDNSSVHRDYGHYLHHIEKRLDLAEGHYLKCLSLFEHEQDCHYFYAKLLAQQERYQEAQHHLTKAIQYQRQRHGTGKVLFHLEFARCLQKLEKFEDSKRQFLICLSLNKINSTVLLEYGQLLCRQMGDYKEGLKYIRTSLNIEYRDETKRVLDRLDKQFTVILEREKQEKMRVARQHKQRLIEQQSRERERGRRAKSGHSSNCNETLRKQGRRGKVERVDDDDHKCDPKEESLEIAQRIRESEFERFMDFQSFLNENVGEEYMNEFKRRNLNDIMLLKIDTNAFMDELGIRNAIHSALIKKKIERFKREMEQFQDWLISLKMEETLGIFEKYGILTFEQFDHHIKSESDLKWLCHEDAMEKHAEVIWNANCLYRARRRRELNGWSQSGARLEPGDEC